MRGAQIILSLIILVVCPTIHAEEPPRPWYGPAPVQAKPKARTRRILLFSADWCGPCRMLKAGLITDLKNKHGWSVGPGPENTIQLIDSDRNRALARQYGITSIPTMIFIGRGDGVNLKETNPLRLTPQSLRAAWDSHYDSTITVEVTPPQTTVYPVPRTVETYVSQSVPAGYGGPVWYHYASEGTQNRGMLQQHLMSEHGYSWSQVASMPYSELKRLHSLAHNAEQRRTRRAPGFTLPAIRIQSPIQVVP